MSDSASERPGRGLWVAGALLGALGVAAVGWFAPSLFADEAVVADAASGEGAAVPVRVAPIVHGEVEVARAFVGTLEPAAGFDVAAKVGGRVEAVLVDLADPVERGEVVLRIEDEELQQAVRAARAELAVARAQLEAAKAGQRIAEQAHRRVSALHDKGVAPAEERDRTDADRLEADAEVGVARARVQQRSAALKAAQVRADYAEVRAEWPGGDAERFVGAREVDEGQLVAPNDPLLSIVDLDPLVAVVYATERDYAALTAGQPVRVTTDALGGEHFAGKVARVAPVFDRRSRQARVELEIPNPEGKLRPGMFVHAATTTETLSGATTVPRDAVVDPSGTPALYVLADGADTVARVDVRLGARVGPGVVVERLDGTPLSGRVVVLGQNLLRDGARVRVVAAQGEGGEASRPDAEGSAS